MKLKTIAKAAHDAVKGCGNPASYFWEMTWISAESS
jgi:hypothetical protein